MTATNRSILSPNGQQGFTIIEVVLATLIIGIIIVQLLNAQSHHVRQAALANQTIEAMHIADALFIQWWGQSGQLTPPDQSGVVPQSLIRTDSPHTLYWHLQPRPADQQPASLTQLGYQINQFQIVTSPSTSSSDVQAKRLVSIDLVVPIPLSR